MMARSSLRSMRLPATDGPPASATSGCTLPAPPAGCACTVTERWTDRRPRWMRPTSVLTGVLNRGNHNREGMEQTLQRLKASAESG